MGRDERVEKVRNLTVVGQSVSDLEVDDAPLMMGTANAAKIIHANGCYRLLVATAAVPHCAGAAWR
jgi:hypothetical protein